MYRRTVIAASLVVLSACATKKEPPPQITYDQESFKEAVAIKEEAILPDTEPTKPQFPKAKDDQRPPVARVEAANRTALQEPVAHRYINAAQIYEYTDGAIYRLYTAPEQVSDIALQPGETLSAVSAGDTVQWAIGDSVSGEGANRRVHILVKPHASKLKTNLVIITNRRSYHLQLDSLERTAMAMVSWTYPQDELAEAHRKAQEATWAKEAQAEIDIAAAKFRYGISGDTPPWRPVRAFDNGSKVYIEFPNRIDQGEAPPLFVVGHDGSSELVNYRMRGHYYIVDRLFGAAELRHGQAPQQVVRISRTDAVASASR